MAAGSTMPDVPAPLCLEEVLCFMENDPVSPFPHELQYKKEFREIVKLHSQGFPRCVHHGVCKLVLLSPDLDGAYALNPKRPQALWCAGASDEIANRMAGKAKEPYVPEASCSRALSRL